MQDFLRSITCITLEYIIWFFIMNALLNLNIKKFNMKIFITIPFILLCSCTSSFNNTQSINFILMHVTLFLWIFIYFKTSFAHTFFLFISGYSIICLTELCIIPVIGISGNTFINFPRQLLGLLLSLVLTLLLYFFVPLHKYYQFIIRRDVTLKIIIANSFLLCIGIVILAKVFPHEFMMQFLFLSLISLITIFINIELFKNRQKIIEQKKQLQAYKDYLPVVENLIQHVRYKQHDYNNAIMAIKMMPLTYKDYDSLCENLNKYTNYILVDNEIYPLLKINLKLVSGFLIGKCMEARQKKISLQISINTFNIQSIVPEYNIIEMMGVLIDNALEASSEGDTIFVKISSDNNKLQFKIMNIGFIVTPDFIENIFIIGYSSKSKKNNHGLGLPRLKELVDSFKGELKIYNESNTDKTFICFEFIV